MTNDNLPLRRQDIIGQFTSTRIRGITMDPEKTLADARYEIDSDNPSQAVYLLTCYFEWRLKGGFEPTFPIVGQIGTARGDRVAINMMTELSDILANSGV